MLAVARVLPCSFAFCATSSSEIKQKTSPPSCASFRLLIPALAIWVSVTMQAPFCSAPDSLCHRALGDAQTVHIVEIGGGVDHSLDHQLVFRKNLVLLSPFTQLLRDDFKAPLFDFLGSTRCS